MSSSLIQITDTLPALRQSMVEVSACPRAYVEIFINGKVLPESIPSERGSEVHAIMADYIAHCARLKIAADWVYFNRLAKAAGPDAGPILDGVRDTYEVDFEHVYATELTLALDEQCRPAYRVPYADGTVVQLSRIPGIEYSEEFAAHTGTLDVTLFSDDTLRAKIEDFKTHPRPFDADTYQSLLYPFMLLKHFPALEQVTFELNFARYRNCRRATQWKRTEMPEMQTAVERARERQRLTHTNPEAAKALPSSVCVYCPLSRKAVDCPIAEFNEYTSLTAEQRLMLVVWLEQMGKIHRPKLKEWAEVHGPIDYRDGNGQLYRYSEEEVSETRFPLDQSALKVLMDWAQVTGENLLDGRLNISSTKLKSYLKTQKRAALREQFEASCIESGTKPKYKVRTPEGLLEEHNPYTDEED